MNDEKIMIRELIEANGYNLDIPESLEERLQNRHPFECMIKLIEKACLIPVNKESGHISSNIVEKSIVSDMDISEVIRQMVNKNKY